MQTLASKKRKASVDSQQSGLGKRKNSYVAEEQPVKSKKKVKQVQAEEEEEPEEVVEKKAKKFEKQAVKVNSATFASTGQCSSKNRT